MSLGPYASFIVTSYALVVFVVIALIAWIVFDHRHQKQALRDLEAGGMTRRSSKSSDKRS